MDIQNILLQPYEKDEFKLKNRVCMAALTRQRCDPLGIPNDLMALYYSQRASAGLILSECTSIRDDSNAFPGCPHITTDAHILGWQKVTKAVHEKQGNIWIQIWHSGRATHSTLQNGKQPVSSSSIPIRSLNRRANQNHEIPHELTTEEVKDLVKQFRLCAENALKAGFDGIQLHGAHGYLIDQFLRDSVNKRTDEYGGSIENRCRFPLEVIDQLIEVYGKHRVAIKVNPIGSFNDVNHLNPLQLYQYLFKELDKRQIAFIELKDEEEPENIFNYGYKASKDQCPEIYKALRPYFRGTIMGNGNLTPKSGVKGIEQGLFDIVSFGKLFICNRDLVERISDSREIDFNFNPEFYYTGGEKGYTDY